MGNTILREELFKKVINKLRFGVGTLSEQRLELIKCISSLKLKNPVFLEAGAADGGDTAVTARLYPRSKIYAFEPVALNYKELEARLKKSKNIKHYQLGLSDKTQQVEIFVSQAADGSNTLALSSSILKPKEHLTIHKHVAFNKTEIIKTVNLDEWAQTNGVDKIDVMWLDMQGAEHMVLKAAPRILSTVRIIFTEVSYKQMYEGAMLYPELKAWLEQQGFRVYKQFEEEAGMGDVIFTRGSS